MRANDVPGELPDLKEYIIAGVWGINGEETERMALHPSQSYEADTRIFVSQMKNLKIRGFESLISSHTVLRGRLQTLSTS